MKEKRGSILEANYLVSRKTVDVNRCEVLMYSHFWLTKRN